MKKTSKLALLAFILTLANFVCLFLGAPLAAVLGLAAVLRLRGPAGRTHKGQWMAAAALSASGAYTVLLLVLAVAGWMNWDRFKCNRNLVAIGKALHEYSQQEGGAADSLDRLVEKGYLANDQTRCPAGGRYVLLSPDRVSNTGVIAHDDGLNHRGERGVLHAEQTFFQGGDFYSRQYVILWLADPMPEAKFDKIMRGHAMLRTACPHCGRTEYPPMTRNRNDAVCAGCAEAYMICPKCAAAVPMPESGAAANCPGCGGEYSATGGLRERGPEEERRP